jgi:excisionase family DNA binding protein
MSGIGQRSPVWLPGAHREAYSARGGGEWLVAEGGSNGDSYTPAQAARVLRVTPARIRQLLQGGELEGERDEVGHWRIPSRAIHEHLERMRRNLFPEGIWADLSVSEWVERVEALQRELGRLEGRLELTKRSESNLLDERDQLLKERDEARDEARRLMEELEVEKSKGFWSRLFGG